MRKAQLKDIHVTINRMGSFTLRSSQSHVSQCGTERSRTYKYKVSITGDAAHLDDKGFLIDNLVVKDYFEKTYERGRKKAHSCEIMACRVVNFVQKYCKDYGLAHIHRIYVELWGTDVSYITAEWNDKK